MYSAVETTATPEPPSCGLRRPVIPSQYPIMLRENFPANGRLTTALVAWGNARTPCAHLTIRTFWDDNGTVDESDDTIVAELAGVELCRGFRGDCRRIPDAVIVDALKRATANL